MNRHAFAVIVALGVSPVTARAQPSVEPPLGVSEFREAVEREKSGDYEGALERFKKLEAFKRTAGVLFHEGYCLEMLGKLAAAFNMYEAADKVAREQKKHEVVTAVHARLEPLGQRVPLVNVTVEPKEAEVRIDGQLATSMSVRVDSGEHDLVASAPGRTSKKLHLTCREGSVQSLALVLEPAPANGNVNANANALLSPPATAAAKPNDAAAPVTEPPREQPAKGSIALPLAVTGGAIVLLAGGVVSFLLAGSAQSDAKATCPRKPSCDDERSEVRTLDTMALGGFLAGAGLGALAVVLWAGRSPSSAKVSASAAGSTLLLRGEF